MDSWVERAARRRPDGRALELPARVAMTYSELAAVAGERARGLAAGGVDPGRRVPIELGDPVEFAAVLHGCLIHGAAAVPIDPRLTDEERAHRAAPGIGSPAGSGEVATVMHTSGTTAAPRPVELTRGNWLANALGSAVALGLDLDERWLCTMPLSHVGGLSILIRSAVYATTVVLHERFDTGAVVEELMNPERRITLVSLVPTMLARLLDAGLASPPSLRWALLGGGPIPPALLARAAAAAVPVAPTYGMTEACSQIATFGRPLHGVTVALSGDRTEEVLVRGAVVAPGAVGADGWLHTGDLGSWDADGRLVIVGRLADTIVTGGENVAPAEVEAVLIEHPTVADVGVYPRHDEQWGELVVAAVVPRDGVEIDAGALRAFCRERLAAFKVPKRFEVVAALPRTPSGKLLRRELSDFVARADVTSTGVIMEECRATAPRSPPTS